MNEDKIKEAFAKAKQDILSIYSELSIIKRELLNLKQQLIQQSDQQTDTPVHSPADNQTQDYQNTAIQQINPTDKFPPTHIPADNFPLKALKSQNSNVSTGNDGVPADRQTDQQTDNSTGNIGVKVRLNQIKTLQMNKQENRLKHIEKVTEFLSSLDDIKKDLRQKIKNLTSQEMSVFSTIYQLEGEGFIVDYSLLAQKLSLTESSIRDYIQRIIKKGLPLLKTKENNKKIILSISKELRKIAGLETIIRLREF